MYCASTTRDRSRICVVEENFELSIIEEARNYTGLYHILHGSLSPARGVGPDQLHLADLLPRLMPENNEGVEVKEIIIAVNPTFKSRTTANYLSRLLKPLGIPVNEIEIETVDIVEAETIH